MDAASVRGEVGEDVGYFYGFIKRPVTAPSFLKPPQPFPQGYEDLSSRLSAEFTAPVPVLADVAPEMPRPPAPGALEAAASGAHFGLLAPQQLAQTLTPDLPNRPQNPSSCGAAS